MLVGEKMKDYLPEMIHTLSKAVTFPSKRGEPQQGMPYGKAGYEGLEYILEKAAQMGFKTKNVDGYCGYAEYGEGEELAAIITHFDVVPEGIGWTHSPYGGEIVGDTIYGRGVSDNKGAGVVALYCLKLLKDLKIVPKRRIRVIFGLDEECGMSDMEYYLEHEELPTFAFTPDSGYPIYRGEMGIARVVFESPAKNDGVALYGGNAVNMVPDRAYMELDGRYSERFDVLERAAASYSGIRIGTERKNGTLVFTAYGTSSHGAWPQNGVNALSHLIAFACEQELVDKKQGLFAFLHDRIGLDYSGATLGIAMSDTISQALTVNLGVLKHGEENDTGMIDIRYPITGDFGFISGQICKLAELYGVAVDDSDHSAPTYVEDDSRVIRLLSAAYEEVTGEPAELRTMCGGTYSRMFRGRCVGFGGMGENAHAPDEYVTFDDLLKHASICAQAVYRIAVEE